MEDTEIDAVGMHASPDNIALSLFSVAGLLGGLSWFVYALCLISS